MHPAFHNVSIRIPTSSTGKTRNPPTPNFPCDSTVSIEGEEVIIKCTIEHVSLDDKPEFQALSYAWGDGACKINLNGTIATVTENLESALQHLQAVSHEILMGRRDLCQSAR